MAIDVPCSIVLLVLCRCFVDVRAASSVRGLENEQTFHRNRRQTETVKYDAVLKGNLVPENASTNTVLFDFNSVNLQNEAASSFRFNIVSTTDSSPRIDNLFMIDENRKLRFESSLPVTERKKYFDFEQYPTIVVIIEATHDWDTQGTSKWYLFLFIKIIILKHCLQCLVKCIFCFVYRLYKKLRQLIKSSLCQNKPLSNLSAKV